MIYLTTITQNRFLGHASPLSQRKPFIWLYSNLNYVSFFRALRLLIATKCTETNLFSWLPFNHHVTYFLLCLHRNKLYFKSLLSLNMSTICDMISSLKWKFVEMALLGRLRKSILQAHNIILEQVLLLEKIPASSWD